MKSYVVLLAMTVLVAASAFAAGTQDEGQEEGPEELSVMWWGSQQRHDGTIEVIEQYSERNNVDVTYEFAGFSDYWTKLSTMAAGGNLPDVIQLGYPHLRDWQGRDMLVPLDEYAESGVIDVSDVPDTTLSGGRIDGDLYAVSLGVNTWTFMADTEMFEDAGITLPDDDWTWEDFETTVMDLHDELGVWGMGAGLPTGTAQVWRSLYLSSGMDTFDYENGGLAYQDDGILIDYLNRILRLQQADAIPHISVQASDYSYGGNPETNPFVEGEAALTYFASNQLVALWDAAGGEEERDIALLPIPRTGDQPANWLRPSMLFAVTRDSSSPELAADFISYFINDQQANRVLEAERGVPVSNSVRADLRSVVDTPARVIFDFVERIADSSTSIPIPPPEPEGMSELLQNVWLPVVRDNVLFEEDTPEEAAQTFREEANDILQ